VISVLLQRVCAGSLVIGILKRYYTQDIEARPSLMKGASSRSR